MAMHFPTRFPSRKPSIQRFANHSDSQQTNGVMNHNINHYHNCNYKPINNQIAPLLPSTGMSTSDQSIEKLNSTSKMFHLILGNLPKNYTSKDVSALVEEAKPVYISQLDETRVFNIKFCHVVLDYAENLNYLIDKLNGFIISGEKLIAAEVQHLLEWREKAFGESSYYERINWQYYKMEERKRSVQELARITEQY